ncbi:competence/damage-inducible protein CinA C-terminal domain protein [Rubellimicrobium thermophilum DSM 16684]|uniref:Competence/damage-inducible protein CinA C-terminal domain protein n=1 Tax=Rubellimicrobium thermophilum DSM 16684 TaxID=1123069 RepID=S9R2H9_9RHOB|nr:CinA family protein [Rubellimicrobium thermophilum]EPX86168.1 competence/damage-inducible protein CinA C-terminal domain protein [Rubellimicrobium thermophilum DSM 16684]
MSAEDLIRAAAARGLRIAVAESCTGGLLAAAITEPAGASAVFDRGFVTYSNDAKRDLLGVSQATLDAHGAVSEEVAAEMALGARQRSDADVAVSVTGIAGPGGSAFKPEGRVCFGLATRSSLRTMTVEFGARGRAAVRGAAVAQALALLVQAVEEAP